MARSPSLALIGLLAVLLPAPLAAHQASSGDVTISHLWARPTTSIQKNGAAYMVIHNRGKVPERLVGVRTPEAERVQIHGSNVTAEEVAQMRAQATVEIPPGGQAALAPGGLHLMLVNLKSQLFAGTNFPMTLIFERAGEVSMDVMVEGGMPGDHDSDETGHATH
jgi:copper(I)-binding protein